MKRVAAFAASLLIALQCWAQAVTPVPALTARVIDQTQTLAPEQVEALTVQLKAIEDQRGTQIVVLMIASTQPEDIFSYSNRVANTWKIGRKDVGDGVLIVVAKNDHKLRIEIAKSLEGAIPDLAASDIIQNVITPAFRQDQYAQGLQAGIKQIEARIVGDASRSSANASNSATLSLGDGAPNLFALIAILILFLLAIRFLGFGNTMLILMSMSRGGGGGSSGGGGFSSGGGGNFGGGGASGDW
jgi:uncharacterized protein